MLGPFSFPTPGIRSIRSPSVALLMSTRRWQSGLNRLRSGLNRVFRLWDGDCVSLPSGARQGNIPAENLSGKAESRPCLSYEAVFAAPRSRFLSATISCADSRNLVSSPYRYHVMYSGRSCSEYWLSPSWALGSRSLHCVHTRTRCHMQHTGTTTGTTRSTTDGGQGKTQRT